MAILALAFLKALSYVLYDGKKRKLDCIFYAKYCNWVIDDEYIDGCMAWEDIKIEWTRNN